MMRYRWVRFFIDTMRNLLRTPNLPQAIKQQEKQGLLEMITMRYGSMDLESKFDRWFELEPPSLCVPVEYHELLREVEGAYIRGDFYPALTGACCLGERILNHLVMDLKNYYKWSPRYSEVAMKQSIQDWEKAISILEEWQIFNSGAANEFRNLLNLRNPAVHFGGVEDRVSKAREAICLVYSITNSQFGPNAPQFFLTTGEIYVKKAFEEQPFTKVFILPHCRRVGYRHKVEIRDDRFTIVEEGSYPSEEIADEEFARLRTEWRNRSKNSA